MQTKKRWFGLATVATIPGILTALAAGGCVGDDPATTEPPTGTPDGGPGSSAEASSQPPADGGVPAVSPDAAPSLGCPLGCLPPAVAGWTGPSAVYDGPGSGAPTACPASYAQKEVDAYQGTVTADPATCDCGTPVVQGAKCTVTVSNHNASDCSDTPLDVTADAPKTTCVDQSAGYTYMKVKSAVLSRGTCTFPSVTKTGAPAPSFEKASIACGLPQTAACEQRADCVATPLPDAPYGRLCIHKAGDESCPSLDYTARFVAYTKVVDERACACTGNPSGGACGTTMLFAKSAGCPIGGVAGDFTTCSVANSVGIGGLAPSGITCTGTPQPSGKVTLGEPVTFCCNR